ncbi:MAG: amidohydrolase family protein [Anaerolineae bacterium]
MIYDLVIKNGTLVTASETYQGDLAIAGGRIAATGTALEGVETIDATGLLVMPGGVDPHVHLEYPQGAFQVVSSDDWLTGTVAAACGGTTTIIDFVEARPGETWMQAFDKRMAQAEPQVVIDYGLHMSFNRADPASVAEAPAVIAAGMTSFKIYMAYQGIRLDDAEMLVALETLRDHGGLPIIHAENHYVIMRLVEEQLAQGHVEPRWHPVTRPVAGEAEATDRALALAEIVGVPMHIVHVSAARGADIIREYRERGRPVTGEVCTQHLLLTAQCYEQPGFEAARYSMAPPLRTSQDNAALWADLHAGTLDFVVTDHCPFTLSQKRGERRTPPFRKLPTGIVPNPPPEPWSQGLPRFNQIPGGAPGIETRIPLTYHYGVNQRRLSLNEFVNVTSTAAAKLYGLYPRKGSLAPGADADILLFDPNREVTITAESLHQNCDYTPYEGFQVKGWPHTVLSRGEVIVRGGEFTGRIGRGQYLKR